FATLRYVQGEDRTRNGSFATQGATLFTPSTRIPGLPRGFFSGVAGAASEPLPGILPLEGRIGIRAEKNKSWPKWGCELSARIVDDQSRVASSLLESPTPGFTIYDVRGFYRPSQRWTFVAGVENLTDKQYLEHLDFRNELSISAFR